MSVATVPAAPAAAPRAVSSYTQIRTIFQLLAISFGVVGAIFLLFPDGTVRVINATGSVFRVFPPAPPSQLRFWLSLGVSYMALVTILAALIQRDPVRHRDLMPILAAGKFCSSFTCLLFFLFSSPTFLYLLNFLVDGSITLIVLGCYVWVALSADGADDQRWLSRSAPMLDALIETMLPAGGAFDAGGCTTPLARDLSGYFRQLHPRGLLGLALLLHAVEFGPYFFGPRRTRFTRLTTKEREHFLSGFEHSRLAMRRQLFASLKLITTMHFYGYPSVQDSIGFDRDYVRRKLLAGPNAAHHQARLQ